MILTDEIGGQVYAVGEVRLHKLAITVRDLIAARIDLELEAHRDHEAEARAQGAAARARAVPAPSSLELRLNGAGKALRPSLFAACGDDGRPDRGRLVETAEEGFASGRFFVLLDDRQAEHLDETVAVGKTGEVTFLLLTPLQGG